jgi:hypothetical protein
MQELEQEDFCTSHRNVTKEREERIKNVFLLQKSSLSYIRVSLVGIVFLTFAPYIFLNSVMNQQMHNSTNIYYITLYCTSPTCFDATTSYLGN